MTSANATAQMLLAYEIATHHRQRKGRPTFGDRFNALGQSGANGIPEVLDEARWGLDWMGKEQTGHYQFYPFMNSFY